ncbi:hypothetical protein [Streptomyces sp. NPDC060275]|uniref:hypothetical protein n=1 Tax=Streptomyces sp. NPDC060275 TaxID=3347090 RepID=UPI0036577405
MAPGTAGAAHRQRIKKAGQTDIPDGMVVYGLRHFFASNCLTHGIPITDERLDLTDEQWARLAPCLPRTAGGGASMSFVKAPLSGLG